MHVDHLKPESDDPLHDSPKGSLIWQFGAKGRRARAYDDIAVLEFRGQCRTVLPAKVISYVYGPTGLRLAVC